MYLGAKPDRQTRRGTSERRPSRLGERLHSSDGEVSWSDRVGRSADLCAVKPLRPLSTLSGRRRSLSVEFSGQPLGLSRFRCLAAHM
jgi:hypothetical protein